MNNEIGDTSSETPSPDLDWPAYLVHYAEDLQSRRFAAERGVKDPFGHKLARSHGIPVKWSKPGPLTKVFDRVRSYVAGIFDHA